MIVATEVVGTGIVEIVNSAVVAPEATVTVDGVTATGSLEDKLITKPPGPAGAPRVTVPVENVPPTTDAGANVRPVSAPGAETFRVAVTDVAPIFAVIVAVVDVVTGDVVTVNVAVVDPANTVTLAGTTTLELLDERVTTDPPVGAGPSKLTVPVDVSPPITVDGSSETPANATVGVIVRVVLTDVVPDLAVMVADVEVVTLVVVTLNVAVDDPLGTVTLAGATALVLLDDKVTTMPPGPAGPERDMVPVEALPPRMELGDIATLTNAGGVIVKVAFADWPPEDAVMVTDALADTP